MGYVISVLVPDLLLIFYVCWLVTVGLHDPLSVLQWEKFLKQGDEIETRTVEEKIESQEIKQCAVLIYTVSYSS